MSVPKGTHDPYKYTAPVYLLRWHAPWQHDEKPMQSQPRKRSQPRVRGEEAVRYETAKCAQRGLYMQGGYKQEGGVK